jgi:hydroxymethylpyrimidine/phosphomethylpyrimidine kinase
VLLKGGHLPGDEVVDVLAMRGEVHQRLQSSRIASGNVHGTGCTLSSAIAAGLALGLSLPQAVVEARRYVLQAIAAGAQIHTGGGHGPLNHGHAPVPMHLLPMA